MGTINYNTSDYVTIGYDCSGIDYDDMDYDFYISEDYETIKDILNQYFFYYFHVKIEPGYYEGFYIDIKYDFPLFYDYTCRQEAQKEITTIKHALLQIVESTNCCAVHPGWCMGYSDYKSTLSEIEKAVKEMRQDVKSTPTYRQYQKGGLTL